MDHAGISRTCFALELADGFQKGLAFDVAHRAAHLDDSDFRLLGGGVAVKTALDLVGDMGDHLDRAASEAAAALLL